MMDIEQIKYVACLHPLEPKKTTATDQNQINTEKSEFEKILQKKKRAVVKYGIPPQDIRQESRPAPEVVKYGMPDIQE